MPLWDDLFLIDLPTPTPSLLQTFERFREEITALVGIPASRLFGSGPDSNAESLREYYDILDRAHRSR